jgi:hypothetical protein
MVIDLYTLLSENVILLLFLVLAIGFTLLSENVILLLFLVLAIGFMLGKIRIAGINAGSTIGVLIAGLVFGHFGFKVDPMTGSIGFALFIFSVGLQAGPSFFSVLMRDGPKGWRLDQHTIAGRRAGCLRQRARKPEKLGTHR